MNEDHIKQYGLRVAEKVRDEVCKAAGSAVGVEWMWVDGDLQAIVASVAVPHEKNTQQPVAWCELNSNGGIAYFDGKPMFMPGAFGNECHPVPLFTAKPVPRDVLMAFGIEIADKAHAAGAIGDTFIDEEVAAIADRYASKVQPDPVNQQMLAALKRLLHKAYKQNWQDNYPSEVECAEAAIAAQLSGNSGQLPAAEAAQPEVQKPVATVTLLNPNGLFATLLIERGANLKNGDELYAAPQSASAQPVAVPEGWQAAMAFARAALAEAIQIAPLDRLPPMAGAAMQQIDTLLSASQKGGA